MNDAAGGAAPVTGLSHVQLDVTDPETSAAWYSAALGLEPFAANPDIGYVALRHRAARLVVVLTRRSDRPVRRTPGGRGRRHRGRPDGRTGG